MCNYICSVDFVLGRMFASTDTRIMSMDFWSSATGKVLASELPKNGNMKCTVLYPASAKASGEIGMCNGSGSLLSRDWYFGFTMLATIKVYCNIFQIVLFLYVICQIIV